MNEIKKRIDKKVGDIILSESIIENIKKGKKVKSVKQFNAVITIIIAFVVLIPSVYAITNIFTMSVNGEEIPSLDNLGVIEVKLIGELNDDMFQKKYNKLSEVEEDLGITFLKSNLCDEDYHLIEYTRLGTGYHYIEIGAYIVGDLKNIVYNEETKYYDWKYGNDYQTPINLKIEINSDPDQQPFDTEYLGFYKYLETIETNNVGRVNILQETETRGKPGLCTIFVSKGIRYTLTGHVNEDTMIDIINSMK